MLSVTAALAVLAVGAVVFSLLVLDRRVLDRRTEPSRADSTSSLLVVTWAPALCKVEPSNSGCRSGHVKAMGPAFVLHGLWPQPSTEQYCDVPKGTPDRSRKPVPLPKDLEANLKTMMSDSAIMTTHEWYAHGTCSGVSAPEYFGVATTLATQANEVLDPLFAQASGRSMTSRAVRDAFDTRFGKGAGARVGLACKDNRGEGPVAFEVRLSLPPVAQLQQGSSSLADALRQGPTVPPGCGQAQVP